eukprot:1159398-Pelagomonas_calceolata.AAC.28
MCVCVPSRGLTFRQGGHLSTWAAVLAGLEIRFHALVLLHEKGAKKGVGLIGSAHVIGLCQVDRASGELAKQWSVREHAAAADAVIATLKQGRLIY